MSTNVTTQNVTIKDVIYDSIKNLESLMIPAEYLETMAIPISRTLHNLKLCYSTIEEKEEEQKKESKSEESPELHVVEGGMEDAEKDQLEGTVQE